MAAQEFRNIRLGLFVIVGTIFFIVALYMIGNKQNLFGSTFQISANFHNINGLMKGNNVRFAGIDVGTVKSIRIINDSNVNVVMLIRNDAKTFIKKNSVASVGTDGLMGNKLVNINSVAQHGEPVAENDVLQTLRPIEMDEMIRTLNVTNENIKVISSNLRTITDKINSRNTLWNLLMDTVIAENVKSAIVNIKVMSNQGLYITGNLKGITDDIRKGKGSIGALLTDTGFSSRINQTIVKVNKLSDSVAIITGDLSGIIKNIKQGKGSVGLLLSDTSLVHNLNSSIKQIDKDAINFNEKLDALKYTWPFKKYYRKQAKAALKAKKP